MRIVPDTNVLISATFWEGDSFRIIQKAERKELDLVLSDNIIKEYRKVLNYKELQEKVKHLDFKFILEYLLKIAMIVEPKEKVNIVEDPDDNKFLEAALEGKADYIISQDNHLLKIKEFRGIRIVNPKEFLNLIPKT